MLLLAPRAIPKMVPAHLTLTIAILPARNALTLVRPVIVLQQNHRIAPVARHLRQQVPQRNPVVRQIMNAESVKPAITPFHLKEKVVALVKTIK